MTNILATTGQALWNTTSFFSTKDPNQDTSDYHSGIYILTAGAGLYLARACCWKKRAYQQLTPKESSKAFLLDPQKLEQLPRATDGKTPVYLGNGFVIKKLSDADTCKSRGNHDIWIRTYVKSKNYSHLKVPKVFYAHHELLSSKRLPIFSTIEDAQKFYRANYQNFTPAIQEFTNLVIKLGFADLLYYGPDAPVQFETPCPRYDNVCPYEKDGEWLLGLVDVEGCANGGKEFRNLWKDFPYCDMATCETLIHLFPFHSEEIITIMQKNGLKEIEENRERLNSIRQAQLLARESECRTLRTL